MSLLLWIVSAFVIALVVVAINGMTSATRSEMPRSTSGHVGLLELIGPATIDVQGGFRFPGRIPNTDDFAAGTYTFSPDTKIGLPGSGKGNIVRFDLGSLETIDVNASPANLFLECGSLTSVTLPHGFGSGSAFLFANNMFDGCQMLTSVKLPTGFGSGNAFVDASSMFRSCQSLKSVTFPDRFGSGNAFGNATIMFIGCSSLKSISTPANMFGNHGNFTNTNMFVNTPFVDVNQACTIYITTAVASMSFGFLRMLDAIYTQTSSNNVKHITIHVIDDASKAALLATTSGGFGFQDSSGVETNKFVVVTP